MTDAYVNQIEFQNEGGTVQSTHDIQDIDHADLARIDGAYEGMTVGNAEQLVSTVGITDEVPYNFRTSGGTPDIGNRETDKIVGGTIAWNQLVNPSTSSSTVTGITITATAHGKKYVGTATADTLSQLDKAAVPFTANHVYLVKGISGGTASTYAMLTSGSSSSGYGSIHYDTFMFKPSASSREHLRVKIFNGATVDFEAIPQIFDLTAMFGSTIADYIYSLEKANKGAGVAWFRKYFPKPYYAYNASELLSVNTSAHNTVGFNAYDNTTGKAKVVGGNQYQITGTFTALSLDGETITPDASGYFTPSSSGEITVTGGNGTDTCIHLVWDGERDGEYEPYVKHTYPLDNSLTLRGIPKLDSANNLYYDGDVYESDGTVTRKYGIVDLGTLNWTKYTGYDNLFYVNNLGIKPQANAATLVNLVQTKYTLCLENQIGKTGYLNGFISGAQSDRIYVNDTNYTDAAAFKTAMSGVYLVYELATPTTEEAEPFTNPQIVDDFGTEEYVDYGVEQGTRDVAIPVGHNTYYQANLRAKVEMMPDSPDGDGDYIVRQTNGINEYVPLGSTSTITDILARLTALENANT